MTTSATKTPSYLITGGSGFVGSYTTRALLAAGCSVVILEPNTNTALLELLTGERAENLDITYIKGSVEDRQLLEKTGAEHQLSGIIHLASALVPFSAENPAQAISINNLGLLNVLDFSAQLGVRTTWASSVSVFGGAELYPHGAPDEPLVKPNTVYGASKAFNEVLAANHWTQRGADSLGIRLGAVYGFGRKGGASAFASNSIVFPSLGKPFPLAATGPSFPWIYVEDAAHSFIDAVRHSGPAFQGETINAPTISYPVPEAARLAARGVGLEYQFSETAEAITWRDLPVMLGTKAAEYGIGSSSRDIPEAARAIRGEVESIRAAGNEVESWLSS